MTRRLAPGAVLALVAPLLAGCVGITAAEAGPAVASQNARQSAVAVDTYYGLGTPFGESGGGIGVGPELRGKVGPNLGQAALGFFAFAMGGAPVGPGLGFVPFARAGLSMLQYESIEGVSSTGFGGVYTSGGVLLPFFAEHGLTLTLNAEYDIRRGNVPDTGFFSLLVGWGAFLADTKKPSGPAAP
ncbi:hypothetical protein BH09MYX1_BH09MYX1_34240 [soil metagenome]